MTMMSNYETPKDLYRFLNTANTEFMKTYRKVYGKVIILLAFWFGFEFAGLVFLTSWSIQWLLVSTSVIWMIFWTAAIAVCGFALLHTIYKISIARLGLRIHMIRELRKYIKRNRILIDKASGLHAK